MKIIGENESHNIYMQMTFIFSTYKTMCTELLLFGSDDDNDDE